MFSSLQLVFLPSSISCSITLCFQKFSIYFGSTRFASKLMSKVLIRLDSACGLICILKMQDGAELFFVFILFFTMRWLVVTNFSEVCRFTFSGGHLLFSGETRPGLCWSPALSALK